MKQRLQGPYRTSEAPARRPPERDRGGLALAVILLECLSIPIGVGISRMSFGAIESASFALAIGIVLVMLRDVRAREDGARDRMMDIVYVVVTVAFFAASVGLVWLFDRL